MTKQKSIIWRVLALLFFAFLWGGNVHAEKKVWASYRGNVVTGVGNLHITYSDGPLYNDDYESISVTISDGHIPEWSKYLKKGVSYIKFDKSFADYRPKSCYKWFAGARNLGEIDGLEYLNTSDVETMEGMFEGCISLDYVKLYYLKTSKVKNMKGMFEGCTDFGYNKFDVSGFETSNVTDMSNMFKGCYRLSSLDVSKFNTSNVTNMSGMFNGCSGLTSLDLSKFNTSKVTDMSGMFNGCSSLKSLDVSKFNTSNVTNMFVMFYGCSSLTSLDLSNFLTYNLSNAAGMFKGCTGLTEMDLLYFDACNLKNADSMFSGCSNLTKIWVGKKFNVTAEGSHGTDMFAGCTKLKGDISFDENHVDATYAKAEGGYFSNAFHPWATLADGTLTFRYGVKKTVGDGEYYLNARIPGWRDSRTSITTVVFDPSFAEARPTSCFWWFEDASNLASIQGIENLNTSEVTTMCQMFRSCPLLETLDVSGFNTSNVTDMSGMFADCSALTTLDVSGFNTSNVTNMADMFYGCSGLTALDLSVFNTSKVNNMSYMFFGCKALASLAWNKYRFNTSKVNNMGYMFSGCKALASLDLSYFNTSEVTFFTGMFADCTALKTVDLTSFDTMKGNGFSYMFSGCSKLTTIYATDKFAFNENNPKSTDMFKGCTSLKGSIKYSYIYNNDKTYANFNGYFTEKAYTLPWATLSDGTLTFRYGDSKQKGTDDYLLNVEGDNPGWLDKAASIAKVVFDPSFAEVRPISCNRWFDGAKSLTAIEGIEYLNTSEVTEMSYMFNDCESLKSLDLTNFDTSNVMSFTGLTKNDSKLEHVYLGEKFILKEGASCGDMLATCGSPTVYVDANGYKSLHGIGGMYGEMKPYVNINANAPYGTLCVPVNGTLDGGFTGFDKLYVIKSVDADNRTITMEEADNIEAGVSYVYRRKLFADATRSIIAFKASDTQPSTPAPKNEDSLLKGTFQRIYAPKDSYILLTDGNFHPVAADDSNPVGAYRAYLDLSKTASGGEASMAQTYRMAFVDGEVTGIGGITDLTGQQPKAIYDLSGRRVKAPQKGGIYIVDGKKIMYNK